MLFNEKEFYIFGLGNRDKYIYTDGKLFKYPSVEPVMQWKVEKQTVLAAEYRVNLETTDGKVTLYEDEEGFYVQSGDKATKCLTSGHVHLPSFDGYKYREQLRILLGEILVNIYEGRPVPSFLVYKKPWYRDGAMMTMVLQMTENLALIKEWAAGLDEMYDRNNKGNEEPDNLGQLLYILAKTGTDNKELINRTVEEAKRRCVNGTLVGKTDYSEHPVYSTKWLKLGLDTLGLDSSWINIPESDESYGRLFWMDGHKEEITEIGYSEKYPYLTWAAIHSAGLPVPEDRIVPTYPMSLEIKASEADYEAERQYFPMFADNRCSAPHTWHASEMFLYLIKF